MTDLCTCGHIKEGHLDDNAKCLAGNCNCEKYEGEKPKYILRNPDDRIMMGSVVMMSNNTEWVTDRNPTLPVIGSTTVWI